MKKMIIALLLGNSITMSAYSADYLEAYKTGSMTSKATICHGVLGAALAIDSAYAATVAKSATSSAVDKVTVTSMVTAHAMSASVYYLIGTKIMDESIFKANSDAIRGEILQDQEKTKLSEVVDECVADATDRSKELLTPQEKADSIEYAKIMTKGIVDVIAPLLAQ